MKFSYILCSWHLSIVLNISSESCEVRHSSFADSVKLECRTSQVLGLHPSRYIPAESEGLIEQEEEERIRAILRDQCKFHQILPVGLRRFVHARR
jgi:hypothetical protein